MALMADLLPMTDDWPVTVADSAAAARRILQERTYDLVLINTPLPDDFGINLAMEVCGGTDAAVAVFVKRERYKEASARLTGHGILTVARPTTRQVVLQQLQALRVHKAISNKRLADFGLISMVDYYAKRRVTCQVG